MPTEDNGISLLRTADKKHLLLVCLAHVYLKMQRPAFPLICSETKAHNVSADGSQRAHPKSKDKFPFQMSSDTVRHTHRDTVFMHMPCVCVVHSPAIRSQLHRCFCNGELIPVSVCVESGFSGSLTLPNLCRTLHRSRNSPPETHAMSHVPPH